MGAAQVSILGAFGSRWDHSYANVMLLYRLAQKNIEAHILDAHNTVMISRRPCEADRTGGTVHIFAALWAGCSIISTQGLKYSITDQWLPLDYPYGISNVFVQPYAEIRVGSGWLIIVKARD